MSLPNPATVHVFVSSTWLDLKPERRAVLDALQRIRETKYNGMEHFGSRDETTARVSVDEVDRSQLYLGIFGGRYGSGITEKEYRRARELNLTCLIYFKDEEQITERDPEPEKAQQLAELMAELRGNHDVSLFTSPEDLAFKATSDLHRWLFDNYLPDRLKEVMRGTAPKGEAEALLSGIKNLDDLDQRLLSQLRQAGLIIAPGRDYIGRDQTTNIYNVPVPTINALYQLPPPRDFTGRKEELTELMGKLKSGGVNISGLRRLGGIGKTALALKLAEQLAARYPDAQFYLDLKGVSSRPLTAGEAMAHVIRAYHPTAKLPEGEAELRGIYMTVLHNQRALLLMDNAKERSQVEPLIPPDSCVLLVTSRSRFHLSGLFAKDLDALPLEDARALLLTIAPRIEEHADTIANLCGCLPLALQVTASAIAEHIDISPTDYARRLADAKHRLELIDASLSLSYELLSKEMQRLWRLLAVFPDTFDREAVAAIWEMEPEAAQESLSALVTYSLVEYDPPTTRYSLHDLARVFTDDRLNEAERTDAKRLHASHFLSVLRKSGRLYSQGGEAIKQGLTSFDLELTNIEAGQSWSEKHADEDEAAARYCSDYPSVAGILLNLRQSPRERIRWLEPALVCARRLKDQSDEGIHLGNLGLAYYNLGEVRRAIEFYEQRLVIAREIGDRRGEGTVLWNMSLVFDKLGDRAQAIACAEASLKIREEIEDPRAAKVRERLAEWRGEE